MLRQTTVKVWLPHDGGGEGTRVDRHIAWRVRRRSYCQVETKKNKKGQRSLVVSHNVAYEFKLSCHDEIILYDIMVMVTLVEQFKRKRLQFWVTMQIRN